MNRYTSFELSKKLYDNGCRFKEHLVYIKGDREYRYRRQDDLYMQITAYDILWDICAKYAKEFFGEEFTPNSFGYFGSAGGYIESLNFIDKSRVIIKMILDEKKQEEIEAYIWDNCLFNPKNKNRKVV